MTGHHIGRYMADEITLKYEGEPTSGGELDAYAVGGSIIAFGDFVGIVTETVFDQRPELRTTVRGLRGGSFDIDFAIYLTGLLPMLAGNPITLVEYLKASLELFKHLKASPPSHVEEISDSPGVVRIDNNEGTSMVFNHSVLNVVQAPRAGEAVSGFVERPMLGSGVTSVSLVKTDGNDVIASINSDESGYFRPIPVRVTDDREPIVDIAEKWLLVESVVLIEGRRKWRFNDGHSSFTANVEDEAFMRRFAAGAELFGMGDQLKVRLRTTQIPRGAELKVNYVIEEIHEHRHGAQQIEMLYS